MASSAPLLPACPANNGNSSVQHGPSQASSLWFVYLAFCFPALAGFQFGYDIGAASGAVGSLGREIGSLSSAKTSLLTSASLFGATAGSIIAVLVGEALGRRRELIAGSALYAAGTVVTIFSPTTTGSQVISFVLAGRITYGVGIALSMNAAPLYIAEIAPARVRGRLVSLKEAFIVLGILCGFAASATFEHALPPSEAWRAIWAPPLPLALAVMLGMWYLPPSPRWLLLRAATRSLNDPGAREAALQAARQALARLRRGAATAQLEAEIREIEDTLVEGTPAAENATTSATAASGVGPSPVTVSGGAAPNGNRCNDVLRARRALVAGLGLVALQQVTGQPSVLYYQEGIFRDAGFGAQAASASVIVGAAKLVATLCTVASVDRFGRRPLLLVGISLMLVALAVLGTAFHAGTIDATTGGLVLPPGWPKAVVCALVAYVCGYQIGFGPVTWLLISEVFPLRLRTTALSLSVVVNFALNLVVAATLDPLQKAFNAVADGKGQAFLFYTYGALCLVSLGFVHFCVPETKGKSLEEIETMLRSDGLKH